MPPPRQQMRAAVHALRFVDSQMSYTPPQQRSLLRLLRADPCEDRVRWFADVCACRRRPQGQVLTLPLTPTLALTFTLTLTLTLTLILTLTLSRCARARGCRPCSVRRTSTTCSHTRRRSGGYGASCDPITLIPTLALTPQP